jgi:AP2 domain
VTKKPNRAEHRPDGTTVIFIQRRNGETYECLIDTVDYPLVKDNRWHILKVSDLMYAISVLTKEAGGKPGAAILLHRLIVPGFEFIDHKNRNGLDDRRQNLRPALRFENHGNIKKPRHGKTSKFKGVCWDKSCNKFVATISIKNRDVKLGRFISEEDAARAYNVAAKEHFGEFANPNYFVPSTYEFVG